jgi:spore maturation protein CgeB
MGSRVLYLGYRSGTAIQRAKALERLGLDVVHLDPSDHLPKNKIARKLHYETGGVFLEGRVTKAVLAEVPAGRFDVVWVDHGRYVGPSLIRRFQADGIPVLNYNVDDPYGFRDRFSWSLYRRCVPVYDLVVVVRRVNVPEAKARGAKKVLFQFRSADEVAHKTPDLTPEELTRFREDVVFVGTRMEDRDRFMADLVRRGVPLAIYGDRWEGCSEWKTLKPHWRGPGLNDPREYSAALASARVCLGLLSKGNRDHHTQRSLEIPLLGGLYCAPRTDEHREMYEEGEEAIFFEGPDECADRCREMLDNPARRDAIARAGHERVLRNGFLNEKMARDVLREVGINVS